MNLIAFVSLFAILLAPLVQGWGEIGHRTIGYLAQKHFDSAGLALFQELIDPDAKFDISDGAVWADLQTWRWPYTKPWHYIDAKDNLPRKCKVDYNADCPKDQGCIVSAIKNMTARVNDASLSRDEQSNALKFLLHFVGDIHQPLHTEDTCRGGNDILVRWGKRQVKLHGVWDKEIIHKLLKYKKPRGPDPDNVYDKFLANGWATTLYGHSALNVGHADIAAECTDVTTPEKCAVRWAAEANAFICLYVLKDGTNDAINKRKDDCHWSWNGPDDVSLGYYNGAVPIVVGQVKKAGMRLGAWINGLAAERAAIMEARHDGEGQLKVQGGEWEL